jgi:uncharacterized membrane protein YphA (DoxX/SURF4 family)
MAGGSLLGKLRAHLVPQRAFGVSLALLVLRVTAGAGLYEAGKGKLLKLSGECAEDPMPDCEKDARESCQDAKCKADVPATCMKQRKAECEAQGQKAIEWFGGLTLFGKENLKLPGGGKLNYTVAAVQESAFGAAVAVGVVARLAAIPAAATMFVAMATAHWDSFNRNLDFTSEIAFAYLAMLLAVIVMGPGLLSVDALFARGGGGASKSKPTSKPGA